MPALPLTDPGVLPFIVIPLALVVLLLWGVRAAAGRRGGTDRTRRAALVSTALGAAVWMAATWLLADSGALRRWDATPPPFALLVVAIVALAVLVACSRYGARLAHGLPLWTLVAVQSFRLPLEIAMHGMYERGVMPVQMSYSGRNFDILTGITAVVVALVARHGARPTKQDAAYVRPLVAAWNMLGLALLINVIVIAILSTPRIRFFGDDRLNVWVTYPPFVWLPAVMVLAALAGHLLIFRALMPRTQVR